MALLSKTSIYIGRKEVRTFKNLYLDQRIDAHHSLEVVFHMETFESDSSELAEKSKEFLGKKIAIQIASISERSNLGVLEFKGIITEIKIVKGHDTGAGEEIIIGAKSSTILADDGAHYDSFSEMSLADIVDKTLRPYQIDHDIAPRYTDVIQYCVQQNESAFTFIGRLAAQYGEWFYFNGEKLFFGKPEIEETELRFSVDLHSFDLSLAPHHQNLNYYTNDYLTGQIKENGEYTKPSDVPAMNGFLFDKSEEIFKRRTTVWNNINNSPKAINKLKAKVKSEHEAIVINQVTLQGSSSNPGVKLGNLIKIGDEKYRVIAVSHSTDRSGHYQNNFKAISGSFGAYPKTDINAFPKSRCQVAIVKENHDPDMMGRIKVQFPWQKETDKKTPWIRMASLHAGGGKGFYFIPEKGEEVIVDFEGGNAETPFVSGCLYHSQAKPPESGSNPNNDIKMLQTKSGCSLTFNDEKGSITLMDKGGSSITLDGSGSVSISGKKSVSVSGGTSVSLSGKKVSAVGSEAATITSDADVSIGGNSVKINGTTTASVDGATVNVTGTTEATITGTAKATITSSGTTSVAGTIIKLN